MGIGSVLLFLATLTVLRQPFHVNLWPFVGCSCIRKS